MTQKAQDRTADVLIVGGGLAGSLTALRFSVARPDLKVILIEESKTLGGHHTWSFRDTDVTADAKKWIEPLIAKSWDEYGVNFPRLKKTLKKPFHFFRSEDLHRVLMGALSDSILLSTKARRVTGGEVELESGKVWTAPCVLDARGFPEPLPPKVNGYQKFIRFDLLLEEPHGLASPVVMDASCPQLDGFRFFTLLPLDERRLVVDESYYSETPDLNHERITMSVHSYAERRGWKIKEIEREEQGTMAVPMTSEYLRTGNTGEALPIGSRAGYFHATTGNGVADSVRIAEFLSNLPHPGTEAARQALSKFRRPWVSKQRFYRVLNRLLFYASEPGLRYAVLQHFYELPDDVIERFYSGNTTWADRVRVLSLRPPVPFDRAWRNWRERSVLERVASEA